MDLFSFTRRHRREDGAYWTGIAYPEEVTFPGAETTSYTAAAVILAAIVFVLYSYQHGLR